MKFIPSLIVFLLLFLMDGLWLFSMQKRFYMPHLQHLLANSVQLLPAIFFYLLFSFALTFFVVMPGLQQEIALSEIFLRGILFGLVTYGTYDLTNQATLKEWPLIVTVVDLLWGSLMTGSISVVAIYLLRKWPHLI